jgi:GDP-L-fucose synthase
MEKQAKIYVAGHTGMVGKAVVKKLRSEGYENVVLRTRAQLDLMDPAAVRDFFRETRPQYVVDCAARVGGIEANMTHPAEFLYENLQIQNNLIWFAAEIKVQKFVFLGSSCIYPRDCPQPMQEESLFGLGNPEPTNEAYAYAKLAGIKFCNYVRHEFGLNFISCVPTNIYGDGDNFDPRSSHVIPALMVRLHEAKAQNLPEISVWGAGTSRREFMHVDDLADAVLWLLLHYDDGEPINIGTGEDISIKELAHALRAVTKFKGELAFDATKPDGMPRKLLDVTRLHEAGWRHAIPFEAGLIRTYEWYQQNIAKN